MSLVEEGFTTFIVVPPKLDDQKQTINALFAMHKNRFDNIIELTDASEQEINERVPTIVHNSCPETNPSTLLVINANNISKGNHLVEQLVIASRHFNTTIVLYADNPYVLGPNIRKNIKKYVFGESNETYKYWESVPEDKKQKYLARYRGEARADFVMGIKLKQ